MWCHSIFVVTCDGGGGWESSLIVGEKMLGIFRFLFFFDTFFFFFFFFFFEGTELKNLCLTFLGKKKEKRKKFETHKIKSSPFDLK